MQHTCVRDNRPAPNMMVLVNLAAETDLGPLAHEAGGQLLDALLPLLQARAGASLMDAAAMRAAVEAAAGGSPIRVAALLLHVGSDAQATDAACRALMGAVKQRGDVTDLELLAAALARVVAMRGHTLLESWWGLAVEAVEAVHQRHGGPLPCAATLQWLVVAAERLGLSSTLRARVLACAAPRASETGLSQDSMLGSLADEMGV